MENYEHSNSHFASHFSGFDTNQSLDDVFTWVQIYRSYCDTVKAQKNGIRSDSLPSAGRQMAERLNTIKSGEILNGTTTCGSLDVLMQDDADVHTH